MIELKDKEKQFYLDILNTFLSKIDKNGPIGLNSFKYKDFFHENFYIATGVTKIVLIPKNDSFDYVLKIPNLEEGDFCATEFENFYAAKKAGLENFFVEIDLFTNTERCPVYIQERAVPNYKLNEDKDWYDPEEDWSSLSIEAIKSIEDMDICAQLMDCLLREYPNELVEDFIKFCAEEDINDLHSENFGYNKAGALVIYDYSGIC